MSQVHYHGYVVSDVHIQHALEHIAEFYGKDVHVTDGYRDEKTNQAVHGSRNSLHLQDRAADFRVEGVPRDKVFRDLKEHPEAIFDKEAGYEFIYHGSHTGTTRTHLHIGHYQPERGTNFVNFKTEGISHADKNRYTTERITLSPTSVAKDTPGREKVDSIKATIREMLKEPVHAQDKALNHEQSRDREMDISQ